MRRWDTKDANGNPLTDGRVCLVITSDTDPDMPEIRTYGKDRDEVLEKLAKTTETAQEQIHRLRKTPPVTPPATQRVTTQPSDVAKAVTELTDPLKAPDALKTILKAGGVDLDQQAFNEKVRNVGALAKKWEREHPDYPADPRNDHIFMKVAVNLAGGNLVRVTAEILDQAFEECKRLEMFHEPKAVPVVTVQPEGIPAPSTVRSATSYRRNSLSSTPEPIAATESKKELKWREIILNGTGKAMDDAIRAEQAGNREFLGFGDYANKLYAKSA